MSLLSRLSGFNPVVIDPLCTLYFSQAAASEFGSTIYNVIGAGGKKCEVEATCLAEGMANYGWEDKVKVWEGPRWAISESRQGLRCCQEEFERRETIRKAMDCVPDTNFIMKPDSPFI